MAHQECHEVGSWVESNISQQVEDCMEQDCIWWCLCCNKWFCFLIWVIVTILTWVVETICELVADAIDLVKITLRGLADFLGGLFTGDWTRMLGGLIELLGGGIWFISELIPVVTGGTLVGEFERSRDAWRLRDYARGLLEDRYKDRDPEGFKAMVDALGIESGGFGLRLKVRALRTFIRSDYSTQPDGTPDLIVWLKQKNLDLKAIAGFDPPAWWSRTWPVLVGDAGSISAEDLDAYVAAQGRGPDVKKFTLWSMSKNDLQTHIDTALLHASEIGLVLQFTTEDVQIQTSDQLLINRGQFASVLPQSPFSRRQSSSDSAGATADLCHPIVIGAFGFTEASANGISAHLANAECLEPGPDGSTAFAAQGITGCAFRMRQPDLIFKYTAIHELGHTFGLCHVDGLLRIMYTAAGEEKKELSSNSSWWQYWTTGLEAGFTFEEGQKVWEYIVRNFSPECLKTRQF